MYRKLLAVTLLIWGVSAISCVVLTALTLSHLLVWMGLKEAMALSVAWSASIAGLMVADEKWKLQDKCNWMVTSVWMRFSKTPPPEVVDIAHTIMERLQKGQGEIVKHLVEQFGITPEPTIVVKETMRGGEVTYVAVMKGITTQLVLTGTNGKLLEAVGAYIKKHYGAGLELKIAPVTSK